MNSLIQSKKRFVIATLLCLPRPNVAKAGRGLFILYCFALGCTLLSSPTAFAVTPAPDGGYANGITAEGTSALFSLTSGIDNSGLGFQALLLNTSTGGDNTATGFFALKSNTVGEANTAVGSEALQNNTTGFGNTAVGDLAGFNLTTGDNNIDIRNQGVAGESSTIRIGDSNQTKTFIAGIRGRTTANNNAIPVLIDSAGQLGTASSSRRFKKEIKPMNAARKRFWRSSR